MPPITIHHKASLDGTTFIPNSLQAITACLEAGAANIEIDIIALADSDYLVLHDRDLTHETTGQGTVSDCSADDARKLLFKANPAIPVALLSDVVALVKRYPQSRLQLDFKDFYPFPTDDPLHRLIRLIEPLGDQVIVSSCADWHLRKLRKLTDWLDLGFDPAFYLAWRNPRQHQTSRYLRRVRNRNTPKQPPYRRGAYGYWDDSLLALGRIWPAADYLEDRCETLSRRVEGISTMYIHHELLAHSLGDGFNWAEYLQARNIQVAAWTVDADNPAAIENAKRLRHAGVHMFTSNTPHELGRLLM